MKIEPVEELNFDINNIENVKLSANIPKDAIPVLVYSYEPFKTMVLGSVIGTVKWISILAICIDMLYMLISCILKEYSLKDKNEKECLEVKKRRKKDSRVFLVLLIIFIICILADYIYGMMMPV